MEHPLNVTGPASADPVNYMPICLFECFRTLPFSLLLISRPVATIVCPRPREPIAIHFIREYDDHGLAKCFRGICPVIDVLVPGAGND